MGQKFVLNRLEIDLKDIAKTWAMSDDREQAKIFNELGRAMKAASYDTNMQLCYMADDLDENGHWLVQEIGEFSKTITDKENKDG